MVSRVGTAAQNQVLIIQQMLGQQQQVNTDQTQLSTGLKSQTFTGIAGDTLRPAQRREPAGSRLQRYLSDNSLVNTTLSAQQTAVQGITDTATTIQERSGGLLRATSSSRRPRRTTCTASQTLQAEGIQRCPQPGADTSSTSRSTANTSSAAP